MKSKFKKSTANRIYRPDWQKTRPEGIISATDTYYVQLSNIILSIIQKKQVNNILSIQSQRRISINIAAYFEDVISGFGLWRAFINIHKNMFGKYLPFYKLNKRDYVEDEINVEDVQFIIWAELQRFDIDNEVHRFLNPENPMIVLLAIEIYGLLDMEYEFAPANEAIYKLIHLMDFTDDIISTRELLNWLHYDSYLSMNYPRLKLQNEIESINDKKNDKFYRDNKQKIVYAMQKIAIFSRNCTPLAIKAKDWLAQIFDGTPKAKIVAAIDFKQVDYYKIVDINNETFKIINVDNEEFIVKLESLSNPTKLYENNTIMCSLLFFNDYWHINGFASLSQLKKELDKDDSNNSIKETNNKTYEYILEQIKTPIVYYKDFNHLEKTMLKLFPMSDKNKVLPKNFKNSTDFVLFIHPEIGLTIYPDLALHVCDPKNPYYNAEVVKNEGLGVLTGYYELPKQLIDYLIDNNLLKNITLKSLQGEEYGRSQLQDNIRFVVRFFQPSLYN